MHPEDNYYQDEDYQPKRGNTTVRNLEKWPEVFGFILEGLEGGANLSLKLKAFNLKKTQNR